MQDRATEPRALSLLLVEDDAVDRMAARRAVARAERPITIEEATTLAEAEERLDSRPFDCVVLDYHLPDGEATTLVERRREDGPPFVILTGVGSETLAVRLLQSGATDYLPKTEVANLVRHLDVALRIHRAERAAREAHAALERRVTERTAELEAANERLRSEAEERRAAEARGRKHLEQLAHVARLSTLGEMVATFAHELHQPLAAISNYSRGSIRLIEAGRPDPGVLRGAFENCASQAERAGTILRRIRGFLSRGEEPRRDLVEIGGLVREVLELLEPEATRLGATLELRRAPPIRIHADGIQIQQVLVNLVRNALDSVADNPSGRERRVLVGVHCREGRAHLEVEDSGAGCDTETLGRILEPFFTRKPEGLGLGLAISRSIAETHGGELVAEVSRLGGLRVGAVLPVADSPEVRR